MDIPVTGWNEAFWLAEERSAETIGLRRGQNNHFVPMDVHVRRIDHSPELAVYSLQEADK